MKLLTQTIIALIILLFVIWFGEEKMIAGMYPKKDQEEIFYPN